MELLMTTWRPFQIGIGKTVPWSNLKSTVNTIEKLEITAQHSSIEWKMRKGQR